MRILHTSDWHLGHTLHELPRDLEHAAFLAWLLDALEEHRVDALLIAGDIFDTANPSAAAQASWYRFLAEARRRQPALEIVAIGGNHDSADRLDAPEPLLAHGFDVRVVGGLPRGPGRALQLDKLIVPLRKGGETMAWVAAVPFLRPADLPPVDEGDPLIEGVRAVYAEVFEAARARRAPGQALIGMGHLYMTSSRISELSERKILGGNEHPLPLDLFPDDLAYVALGHLHLPQKVGHERVRYSGSPIPLSMGEIDYPHQVSLVDLEGEALREVRPLRVPRSIELLRIPKEGAIAPDALFTALEALPPAEAGREAYRSYLELRVRLDGPDPRLRGRVEEAIAAKAVRLVRLGIEFAGAGESLADRMAGQMLDELRPEQVFENRWRAVHGGEPPNEMLAAFHELIDAAHQRKQP